MRKLKIIISGGGTGGHIFPAVAIAKSIEERISNVEFLFVGAQDRMEMHKIPAFGYKIRGLWISGFQRKFDFKNLIVPFKLIHSVLKSVNIINKFNPDIVIGTGGYASGPLIYTASKKGIPAIIQEQNSYAGITNKILGNYVEKICVAYEGMNSFFPKDKIILTGNPIRKDILECHDKKEQGLISFDIDASKSTILVFGGSLGARTINNTILNNIKVFQEMNVNLIWQTGLDFYKTAKKCIDDINIKGITSHPFIKDMSEAYAVSDIIISRAGAITISELCCVGKPVILVPSPNVAENHQYKNAQSLVNKNAALLVEDRESNRKLVDTVKNLIRNKALQQELSHNIKKMGIKDAGSKIADIALSLL